jgi:hypothetical protein
LTDSVQDLSSFVLAKNPKIKIIISRVVCETWSPTLQKEHRSRVFENTVLRNMVPRKGKFSYIRNILMCKGKEILLHAMEAQRVRGGTAPTLS